MTRRILLHSPLDPVTLATKLRDVLGGEDAKPQAGVTGHGSERDMTLFVYRRSFRSNRNITLTATMEPDGTGTRIKGKIGASSGITCFMIAWFGFLSIFVVFAGIAAAQGAPFEFWGAFGGIPLAMMVLPALLFRMGTSTVAKDETTILQFLAKTVQAREA